jgi:hypothetical protein
MAYLFMGMLGMLAGVRVLGLRRRQVSAATAPASSVILRPGFLAVLAGVALAGGLVLLAGGVLVLVQG